MDDVVEQDPVQTKPNPLDVDYSQFQKPEAPPTLPPRNTGGPVASLWDSVRPDAFTKTARAVTRGALEAVKNTGDLVESGLQKASTLPGLSWLGRTKEEHDTFQQNWKDNLEGLTGEAQTGGYAVIQGISQFTTGMMALGKVLPGLGAAAETSMAARVGQGALADLSVLDPHAKRLSDALNDTPFANVFTHALGTKDGDSEWTGRVKNALEGAVTGMTLDALITGIKAVKMARAGKGVEAEELLKQEPQPGPYDLVKTEQTAEGQWNVVEIKSGDKPVSMPPQFPTQAEAEVQAAGVNMVNRNQKAPTTPEQIIEAFTRKEGTGTAEATAQQPTGQIDLDLFKQVFEQYEAGGDPRDVAQIMNDAGVNLDYVQTTKSTENVVKALIDSHSMASVASRGRVVTHEETMQNAFNLGWGGTPEEAYARVSSMRNKTEGLASEMYWGRVVQWAMAHNATKLARAAVMNPDSPELHLALESALESLHAVHAENAGTAANVARALDQQKITVTTPKGGTDIVHSPNGPQKILDGKTPQEIRDIANMVTMSDGDPGKILGMMAGDAEGAKASRYVVRDESAGKKVWNLVTSWRINAMLGNPVTHVTNFVSNGYSMVVKPLEAIYSGAKWNNQDLFHQGVDMLSPTGMLLDIGDSFKAMGRALLQGDGVLHGTAVAENASHSFMDLRSVFDEQSPWQMFKNALSTTVSAPTRFLMTSDEFFQQMNYRMMTRAQVLRQAREQGVTDAGELLRRQYAASKLAFTPNGEGINDYAKQYAKVATYTNDLGHDTMGQTLLSAQQKHPLIGMILPFVKTPTNVFRFAQERTPLLNEFAAMSKLELASGDPARIAVVKGKAETGAMVWALAAGLAYNGTLTGGGPPDKALRDQLKSAGWQPYSVKIGDRYVSIKRADPIFTSFAIAADIAEMSGNMDNYQASDAVSSFMAGVAASVTSKNYMQGLSDFFDAVSANDSRKFDQLFNNTAGSFIPTELRGGDTNPHIMETRSFVDEMKARVPGYSEQLEPKRNIFGEKFLRPPGLNGDGSDNTVNPFTISGKVTLPGNVMNELVKLGKGIPLPNEHLTSNGASVDLTDRGTFDDLKRADGQVQSPYDRWLENMGKTGLKEQLSSLVQSEDYKSIPSDELRSQLVMSLVKASQQQAFEMMSAESPKVQQARVQLNIVPNVQKAGGPDALKETMATYTQMFVRTKTRHDPSMKP